MEGPTRVPDQPGADLGLLVGCVVVEDDVDSLVRRELGLDRVEEADELLMAVALHVAADHRAVEHVERSEQRGGAVALVIVRHRSAAPLFQGQSRLAAIERLDLAFLVDREDDRMGGRIDIEPDDVVQLLGERLVVRQLEAAPAVRRQAVIVPDLHHRGGGDADRLGHRANRPVRRFVGRRLQRQRDHLVDQRRRQRRGARRPGLVAQQAVHALDHEPLLPSPDAVLRFARRRHDRHRADILAAEQNDPGTPDVLLW